MGSCLLCVSHHSAAHQVYLSKSQPQCIPTSQKLRNTRCDHMAPWRLDASFLKSVGQETKRCLQNASVVLLPRGRQGGPDWVCATPTSRSHGSDNGIERMVGARCSQHSASLRQKPLLASGAVGAVPSPRAAAWEDPNISVKEPFGFSEK